MAVLFFVSFYYFWPTEDKGAPPQRIKIDSVELKMGAPDRAERVLTAPKKKEIVAKETTEEKVTEESSDEVERTPAIDVSAAEENALEQIEEMSWSETESAWNGELKEILYRLDPQESENIHKAYTGERESYLSEVEGLLNEKKQKTSPEAAQEIEQMIAGLEEKHEEKIKEIFGSNYEAIREQYDNYMENNPAPSEE